MESVCRQKQMNQYTVKAVIFDMYETLVTQYRCPVYFGTQMAQDLGVDVDAFQRVWRPTEDGRTLGTYTLETALEYAMRQLACYTPDRLAQICEKRIRTKQAGFLHLHEGILPMLAGLKDRQVKIGLVSNCFSEEAYAIRNSVLYPYFDHVCLSCEMGIKKPDPGIFQACLDALSVAPSQAFYVGDGGSGELEAAAALGMQVGQAMWYIKDVPQLNHRKPEFEPLNDPEEILF